MRINATNPQAATAHTVMQFDRNNDYPPDGRPSRDPVPFPSAVHQPCTRFATKIFDPGTKKVTIADRVLKRTEGGKRAYRLGKTLQKAIYGKVVSAVGLRKRTEQTRDGAEWEKTDERYAIKELEWRQINRQQALSPENRLSEDPLKEVEAMQFLKHWCEDNGIAGTPADQAMLETNVMMPVEVLSDNHFLYLVMPHCDGGEMFDMLEDSDKFTEGEARYWMHQILRGVETMQRAGVCHRDVSLENLLVHRSSCIIIDMGMCIRVPEEAEDDEVTEGFQVVRIDDSTSSEPDLVNEETDMEAAPCEGANSEETNISARSTVSMDDSTSSEPNLVNEETDEEAAPCEGANTEQTTINARSTDVSKDDPTSSEPDLVKNETDKEAAPCEEAINEQRTRQRRRRRRCLVNPSGTCGKWGYMSPEIALNKVPFDGYAVDMWAVGVILFMMLTGFRPWDHPIRTDTCFRYITAGGLQKLLSKWKAGLTEDAMDLLQRMMLRDPMERLSLEQVRAHKWMVNGQRVPPAGP